VDRLLHAPKRAGIDWTRGWLTTQPASGRPSLVRTGGLGQVAARWTRTGQKACRAQNSLNGANDHADELSVSTAPTTRRFAPLEAPPGSARGVPGPRGPNTSTAPGTSHALTPGIRSRRTYSPFPRGRSRRKRRPHPYVIGQSQVHDDLQGCLVRLACREAQLSASSDAGDRQCPPRSGRTRLRYLSVASCISSWIR